jgi:hypothetical protein
VYEDPIQYEKEDCVSEPGKLMNEVGTLRQPNAGESFILKKARSGDDAVSVRPWA